MDTSKLLHGLVKVILFIFAYINALGPLCLWQCFLSKPRHNQYKAGLRNSSDWISRKRAFWWNCFFPLENIELLCRGLFFVCIFCELLNYHYGCLFWFSFLCLAYKQPLPFLDRLWKFLSNITFAYLTRSFSKVHELLKGDGNPIHGIRPQRWDETSITWIKTTEIHFGYIYS